MALNKKLLKFLLFTFALYGLWLLGYELFIKPSGNFDHLITENITYFICLLLDITGYQTHYTLAEKWGETYIFLIPQTNPLIRVGASCNGLELLVLFTIFIICYPGPLKNKAWFIPLGLLIIHVLNILRNYTLTLMQIHKSPYFEFFHRYIFIFMVYGVIFLLWMWWANIQQAKTAKNETE
ncbi:MAG: archaeosortase/exosortase family protein [Bacteroidota bacterium]